MRILFLAHRTPYPPNKGEKIRAFNLLSHLAKNHDVTLLYWVDDPQDLNHTPFLRSLCRGRVIPVKLSRPLAAVRAICSLLSGKSFTEGFYNAKPFQRELDNVLCGAPFEAVFVFSSAVACYAKAIDATTKIIDFVDVDSVKWQQLAETAPLPLSLLYRLEHGRLSAFEISVSRWATRSVFVSRAEAELFKQTGGQGSIDFLSNGTDLELRRLPLDQVPYHLAGADPRSPSDGERLIFVGTMDYSPNIDAVRHFAHDIFPLIRDKFPRAVFEIVGRRPPKSVRRLGRIAGVRVVGEVDDVRSYLVRADVSVAPMRIARGVQNKVLEAMAVGVPVVATPPTIEGIEVHDGEEVLIGATSVEFAQQVIRLLSDAELRKAVTRKAWNKMNQSYNWESIGAKLDRFLTHPPIGEPSQIANVDISRAHR
jgi:sugar transferase (PEP-CTERM/EpsH1 system associated)